MSDISDVTRELVKFIAKTVYPNITFDAPDAAWDSGTVWDNALGPSIVGKDIVVYPGWPSSKNLDDDLRRDKTHITVFPKPDERNTTRYAETDFITVPAATTITLELSYLVGGQVFYDAAEAWDEEALYDVTNSRTLITLGGTISVPQNIALRINGKFYTYAVGANDTLATIAATLAALVVVDHPLTAASNDILTVGPSGRVQAARAGGVGTVAREVARQERIVMITVWTSNPTLRDQITSAVDAALKQTRFLAMPDGYGARLIYKNSPVIDSLQKAVLYRRDLNYSVEFATTVSEQAPAVIAPSGSVNEFIFTA